MPGLNAIIKTLFENSSDLNIEKCVSEFDTLTENIMYSINSEKLITTHCLSCEIHTTLNVERCEIHTIIKKENDVGIINKKEFANIIMNIHKLINEKAKEDNLNV